MKRFISALALCFSLLILLSIFLFPPVKAKEDPIAVLLTLPAPPPPNPLVTRSFGERDPKFYDRNSPPKDNAATADILAYWAQLDGSDEVANYMPEPSPRTVDRIKREIEKRPNLLTGYLNILKRDPDGAEFVKGIYDSEGTTGVFGKDDRRTIRHWLVYNSPYFSGELAKLAENVGDTTDYVSNQDELIALARVDFEKARPIVDRLYNDPESKTSRVLAKWALYHHALATDSIGDIDQYRDELKAVVEDKGALPGMRDLAMDALVQEKEWPGRDEWYFSLLGDGTLADLKVNGQTYTGLTTLILASPTEKYQARLLELLKGDNPTVRGAVIRDLVTQIQSGGPELIKALIPWLEDPKWAPDVADSRGAIVRRLAEFQIPDSVPGLIKMLDERAPHAPAGYPANSTANTMRPAANGVITGNLTNANARPAFADEYIGPAYPFRYSAVAALDKQKDPRAVPALRRILPEGESYERSSIVKALLDCGGFSIGEQLDALDLAAKGVRAEIDSEAANAPALQYYVPTTNVKPSVGGRTFQISGPEIKQMLAQQLLQATEISDELARAVVDKIEGLDKTDPQMSAAYRRMILKWQNAAINVLLLRDVKHGVADTDTIVRLLSQRKELREKQGPDVFDIRTGTRTAVGISACLIEDAGDYDGILQSGEPETKTAMLACARLIRAKLPVAKVAENLNGSTPALNVAAERYLESEDSPEARMFVLSRHTGEAKILGATTAFNVDGGNETTTDYLWALYQSLGNDSLYNGWGGSGNDDELEAVEKNVQAEVKKDDTLLGIYAYDKNYIRIYKDRVVLSWDEDESRYRERPMSSEEFAYIKTYLIDNKADELPPFLACGGAYCTAKELVMVGRNGGRRVYANGESDFFSGLDKYFADLRLTPATLKYGLSREIPSLEIILASDDLHVSTVWKNGDDLRVCASKTAIRKKVKEDIEKIDEETDAESDEAAGEAETKKAALTEKRQWEGFGWYRISGGETAPATQPADVEVIPTNDGLGVQPDAQAWKTRAAGIEIRASNDGLFKVARGRLTRLRAGNYSYPFITPNGRWAFAYKSGENAEDIVRVDLLTNREYPVAIEGYGTKYPQAYASTLGKVLVVRSEADYDEGPADTGEDDDTTPADDDPANILLVDPVNGMVFPVTSGELRPLTQQTFRPLQRAAQPEEFWAAMPDAEKNETRVGIYNAKWLTFKPVRTIPKIKFNSMDMWVDDAGGKIYFVYRGHLLALPLKAAN